jgi:hypothetical protein
MTATYQVRLMKTVKKKNKETGKKEEFAESGSHPGSSRRSVYPSRHLKRQLTTIFLSILMMLKSYLLLVGQDLVLAVLVKW